MKIKTPYNSTYTKVAVQCSADTFVLNQNLVLRINNCGENPPLRHAANRYPEGINKSWNVGWIFCSTALLCCKIKKVTIYDDFFLS